MFAPPSGWTWSTFEFLADLTSGVTKGRKLAGRETASYPYLRVANVQRWKLALQSMKTIEIPIEELSKYQLTKGDLLMTEGGDWDKLGRTAIWKEELPVCLYQNHVFRARVSHDGINNRWLMMFMNSPVGRAYFESASKKTTNLASINMTQLRGCPVPIPPSTEQERIVAKAERLLPNAIESPNNFAIAKRPPSNFSPRQSIEYWTTANREARSGLLAFTKTNFHGGFE